MTLERKAIRRAVIRSLRGRTAAGAEVHGMRADPVRTDSDGPFSMSVYTLAEDVAVDSDAPRSYERTLELAVEIFVERVPELQDVAADLSDAVDDLVAQVEALVEPCLVAINNLRVEGLRCPLQLNPSKTSMQRVEVEVDKDGRQLAGNARVVWRVVYFTEVDEEELADPRPLDGLRVTYDFPPPPAGAETVEAVDVLETPAGAP